MIDSNIYDYVTAKTVDSGLNIATNLAILPLSVTTMINLESILWLSPTAIDAIPFSLYLFF